jgi:hypothetical protein
VDLNHRPLGYEFDSWFACVHAVPYISAMIDLPVPWFMLFWTTFFWEVVAGLAALLRGGSRGGSTPFARAQILDSQPKRGACFGVPGLY